MNFTFTEFSKTAQELSLKAHSQLRQLVLDVPNHEELLSDSTHYERLDKLVLWNSEDQSMQIRLHIYRGDSNGNEHPNLADISDPHNHRWSFMTRILSGGYSHTIYSVDALEKAVPTVIRNEVAGSSYTLHHAQYHSIIERPNTVSLIVRGPVEKKSFQVIEKVGDESQIKDSSKFQSPQEKSQKMMTRKDYENAVELLHFLKII